MVDEVRADGIVPLQRGGDQDLGADTVGRADQRARRIAREPEEAAKTAQAAELVGVRPSARYLAVPLDCQISGIDVDAGARVRIRHRRAAPAARVNAFGLSTVG